MDINNNNPVSDHDEEHRRHSRKSITMSRSNSANNNYNKKLMLDAKEMIHGSFSSATSTSLDSLHTVETGEIHGSGHFRPSIWVFVAVLAAQMSSLSMGAGFGWSAPATEEMSNKSLPSPYHGEDTEINFVASTITLGAFIGAFFCGVAMDFLGRKKTLILLGVPYFIGWLIIALAHSLPLILIGRFLTGFPIGITSGVLPTYVAEISTPNIRGFLGMLFNVS